MTKEERAEYQREYRKVNKEKPRKNTAKRAAQKKSWMNSKKSAAYIVYLLPEENYVGQTVNLYRRLSEHKCRSNRNVTGAKVLGEYKTKDAALAIETEYHANGFNGAKK